MKYLIPTLAFLFVSNLHLRADSMPELVQSATKILDARQGSVDPIPNEILANAKGVAILTVLKGGIGVGGQGGEGIVMVKHEGGTWRAPSAFSVSGASIGAQLGFTSIRYIIILNTQAAIGQFVNVGKLKWDATATGTAGDDTGVAQESTRDLEKHAVLVYRDSGGLFGGATLGGSSIEVDDAVNQKAYGANVHIRDILEGTVPIPEYTQRLYSLLNGKR